MDEFQLAHYAFIAKHLAKREGQRLKRLKEGHGYAETSFLRYIWWKAFGNFDDLHPEYEIKDFRDGTRFLDFAYIRHSLKIAIEIDGFGPHYTEITRAQFSDQLIRQNHLVLDGWKVFRFSLDDVKNRPRMCEQILQQCIGKYFGDFFSQDHSMSYIEREIIRLANSIEKPIRPVDIQKSFQFGQGKSQRILKAMCAKAFLKPAGQGTSRIRSYSVNQTLVLASWEKS
ncbi:hypothetical protein A8709_31280 [Paenibacillus pectinilyticus]|uniref:DUF559 domain-containing protein n=1 Tax=Paenibacillus pectinilyticus TaxID=512399 RepID=A0A1C0ZW30_9BACL|nr:hypothetical protein [Paenibacillus pectinilyticus]OCT12316.1 hypothetical protein A8709_31280 [Paenibacillus pectinilyticus]